MSHVVAFIPCPIVTGGGVQRRFLVAVTSPEGMAMVYRKTRKMGDRPVMPTSGTSRSDVLSNILPGSRSNWKRTGFLAIDDGNGGWVADSDTLAEVDRILNERGERRADEAEAAQLVEKAADADSLADAAKRAAEEHHAAQLAAMGSTLLNPSAPAPVATQPAKPAGPPPLPPRPEALRFHYESDGPLSAMDIATKLAADPDERHLVWREGMEGWVNAADVSLIASLMTKLPPALPAKEEVVPEAAVVEAAELAVDEAAEA
jgi:hypothetical protein